MSRPATPTATTSISELEARLKELELRYLGPPSEKSVTSNPFAPVSSLAKRISKFRSVPSPSAQNVEEIATSSQPKITSSSTKLPLLPLPNFDGSDYEGFLKSWERWLRISGVENCEDRLKMDWLVEACTPKVRKLVEKVVEENPTDLVLVLERLELLFPKLENDLTLRIALDKIPQIGASPEPAMVAQLFVELEDILARMSFGAISE